MYRLHKGLIVSSSPVASYSVPPHYDNDIVLFRDKLPEKLFCPTLVSNLSWQRHVAASAVGLSALTWPSSWSWLHVYVWGGWKGLRRVALSLSTCDCEWDTNGKRCFVGREWGKWWQSPPWWINYPPFRLPRWHSAAETGAWTPAAKLSHHSSPNYTVSCFFFFISSPGRAVISASVLCSDVSVLMQGRACVCARDGPR